MSAIPSKQVKLGPDYIGPTNGTPAAGDTLTQAVAKLAGALGTLVIPEYAADPYQPVAGQAWILRTVVNPAGTLGGMFGGVPLGTPIDQDSFALSVNTTYGVKRVMLT